MKALTELRNLLGSQSTLKRIMGCLVDYVLVRGPGGLDTGDLKLIQSFKQNLGIGTVVYGSAAQNQRFMLASSIVYAVLIDKKLPEKNAIAVAKTLLKTNEKQETIIWKNVEWEVTSDETRPEQIFDYVGDLVWELYRT